MRQINFDKKIYYYSRCKWLRKVNIISNAEKTEGYSQDGIASPNIAIERVVQRVAKGGHGVPEEDIKRRYHQTFENLKIILPLCDLAAIYDNSVNFRRFALYKKGELVRLSKIAPEWYKRLKI